MDSTWPLKCFANKFAYFFIPIGFYGKPEEIKKKIIFVHLQFHQFVIKILEKSCILVFITMNQSLFAEKIRSSCFLLFNLRLFFIKSHVDQRRHFKTYSITYLICNFLLKILLFVNYEYRIIALRSNALTKYFRSQFHEKHRKLTQTILLLKNENFLENVHDNETFCETNFSS